MKREIVTGGLGALLLGCLATGAPGFDDCQFDGLGGCGGFNTPSTCETVGGTCTRIEQEGDRVSRCMCLRGDDVVNRRVAASAGVRRCEAALSAAAAKVAAAAMKCFDKCQRTGESGSDVYCGANSLVASCLQGVWAKGNQRIAAACPGGIPSCASRGFDPAPALSNAVAAMAAINAGLYLCP